MIIRKINGKEYVLNEEWLRITENPIADKYPKTGEMIELENHNILPDAEYLVAKVEEFEPPWYKDEDGRDIRVSLFSRFMEGPYPKTRPNSERFGAMNGVNIRKAIKKEE